MCELGLQVGVIAHVTSAVGHTEEQFDKGDLNWVMRSSERYAEPAGAL
jgi:hypothetical protein